MELETTIIVTKEVTKALRNLYSRMIDEMNWDEETFIEACLAIVRNEDNFEWGLTQINIKYMEK